jgi:hypothetical protein
LVETYAEPGQLPKLALFGYGFIRNRRPIGPAGRAGEIFGDLYVEGDEKRLLDPSRPPVSGAVAPFRLSASDQSS